MRALLARVNATQSAAGIQTAKIGRGRILVGELEAVLAAAGVRREALVDAGGLSFVRRRTGPAVHYFLVNGSDAAVARWVPLAAAGGSAVLLDPMTGMSGIGEVRAGTGSTIEVRVSLQPGESVIVRVLPERGAPGARWPYWNDEGAPTELSGTWHLRFIEGGPELPRPVGSDAPGVMDGTG